MKPSTHTTSSGSNAATVHAAVALSLPLLAALVLSCLAAPAVQAAESAPVAEPSAGVGTGTAKTHRVHKKATAGMAKEMDYPTKPQGEVRALKQK